MSGAIYENVFRLLLYQTIIRMVYQTNPKIENDDGDDTMVMD